MKARCTNAHVGMLLVLALLSTWACAPSAEELALELYDLQAERKLLLDALYEEYGGGVIATAAQSKAESSDEASPLDGALDIASSVISEADRAVFESNVRTIGKGKRPVSFSPAARDFFSQRDVAAKAREVVELDLRIEMLEKRIERLERGG